MDGSSNVQYGGIFCNEVQYQIEIATTGGGGATKLTTVFEVEVQIDCDSHIIPATISSLYSHQVAAGKDVDSLALFTGFTTLEPVRCPFLTFQLYLNGAVYSGSNIAVDALGDVTFEGFVFNEGLFELEVTTSYG